MLQEIVRNKIKIALVVILVLFLALIRAFEESLFYDPFAVYFQNDYLTLPFPKYHLIHLFWSLFFRYFLNTTISLAIIYILFQDLGLTKFAAIMYLILFLILIIAFFTLIHFTNGENNFMLFYVRRFLIQPLFLILFIPAFFYQKQIK
jgi:exosortase F-associated protein